MILLESFSLGTVLIGILVCFLAGVLGGVSGFGTGLLVSMFLLPVIGPKALIPVTSVLMLINNGSRVWFFRSAVDLRTIVIIAGAALPTAYLGALVYVRLESAAVQILLGITLIATVPLRRFLGRHPYAATPAGMAAIGGVYGFLSSVIIGAGMLIVPLLLGIGLSGSTLLATDAAIAVIVNVWKVIVFGRLDALDRDLFILAVLIGLATIPGTACAAYIVKRTSLRLHTAVIEGLVVVGGITMIVNALRQ